MLVVDQWKYMSSGANDDDITTDVTRRSEMITRIVNVCDQKDAHSGERVILVR